jgi:hypothetical protein
VKSAIDSTSVLFVFAKKKNFVAFVSPLIKASKKIPRKDIEL